MLTIKHTMSYTFHVVDLETGKSNCNRDASDWFTGITGNYGYDFSTMKCCKRCGSVDDFNAVQKEILARYEKHEQKHKEQRSKAGQLAKDKKRILTNQVWPDLKHALLMAGFDFEECEPSNELQRDGKLRVSREIDGHTFWFEINPPQTSYGTYTNRPYEIVESQPYWVK